MKTVYESDMLVNTLQADCFTIAPKRPAVSIPETWENLEHKIFFDENFIFPASSKFCLKQTITKYCTKLMLPTTKANNATSYPFPSSHVPTPTETTSDVSLNLEHLTLFLVLSESFSLSYAHQPWEMCDWKGRMIFISIEWITIWVSRGNKKVNSNSRCSEHSWSLYLNIYEWGCP